uniref:Uncharacterized protein n=1 Tax=Octopus bimaculoides TaxID=37653 RepID=A0A0L8FXG3_OCTBM
MIISDSSGLGNKQGNTNKKRWHVVTYVKSTAIEPKITKFKGAIRIKVPAERYPEHIKGVEIDKERQKEKGRRKEGWRQKGKNEIIVEGRRSNCYICGEKGRMKLKWPLYKNKQTEPMQSEKKEEIGEKGTQGKMELETEIEKIRTMSKRRKRKREKQKRQKRVVTGSSYPREERRRGQWKCYRERQQKQGRRTKKMKSRLKLYRKWKRI